MPACYRRDERGLTLFVRVTPNAGRDAIETIEVRDDGGAVLRLRVKAVPDRGRANAAVAALLAKALGVPKSAVTVTAGETARMKTLHIAGNGATLARAIDVVTGTS